MLISHVLSGKGGKVLTASPEQSLEAIASILWSRRIGALVVTDDQDTVVGIISERDLVRAVAEGGEEGLRHKVRDIMTRDVVLASPSDNVDEMLTRMTDRRFRHLPVCDAGRLVGIVSIGDLVKAKIEEAEAEAQHLRAYIAS